MVSFKNVMMILIFYSIQHFFDIIIAIFCQMNTNYFIILFVTLAEMLEKSCQPLQRTDCILSDEPTIYLFDHKS